MPDDHVLYIDNTNLTVEGRKFLIDEIRKRILGKIIYVHYQEMDMSVLLSRLEKRSLHETQSRNTYEKNKEILELTIKNYQTITYEELILSYKLIVN